MKPAGSHNRVFRFLAGLCLAAAIGAGSACSLYKPRYELYVTGIESYVDMLGYAQYEFTIESRWAEGLGYAKIFFEARARDGTVIPCDVVIPQLLQGETYEVPSDIIYEWTDSQAPVSVLPVKAEIHPQTTMLGMTAAFAADSEGWKAVYP